MTFAGNDGKKCGGGGAFMFAAVWHVNDHAEGKAFASRTDAKTAYDTVSARYAKRLYISTGDVESEYGSMPDANWAQLDAWFTTHAGSPPTNRVFGLEAEVATEEACKLACHETPECVTMSGEFGKMVDSASGGGGGGGGTDDNVLVGCRQEDGTIFINDQLRDMYAADPTQNMCGPSGCSNCALVESASLQDRSWCVGCKVALDSDHTGAIAFTRTVPQHSPANPTKCTRVKSDYKGCFTNTLNTAERLDGKHSCSWLPCS